MSRDAKEYTSSKKKCNSQTSLSLINFTVNSINNMSLNRFTMKIYSLINLVVHFFVS
jgi:hypothetical protein